LKQPILIFIFSCLVFQCALSQPKPEFSLATDVSLLRSFRPEQRYWAIGQTIIGHLHFSPADGAYAWFGYYSDGKFHNSLTADAKASATSPQQITFNNDAQLRFKHISLGWKHYFIGAFDANRWNLYGSMGFGLMLGRVINTQSIIIDTAYYYTPLQNGKAHFRRLTFDLVLGNEFPIGSSIFFYCEGRVLVPTTDYPSPYLLTNEHAPFTATICAGLRILFD
jgi:hypothetical protein